MSIHYSRRVLCRVQLRSAKPLPSAALGKELSAYPLTAKVSLPAFAECRMSGTRQRISRVPRWHSAKKSRRDGQVTVMAPLPSATRRHSAKKCVFYFLKKMLCRVPASGTRQSLFSFFWIFFAECCR